MITFTSDKFKPYLPDESQVNPNCYGFELAQWISFKLAEKNIVSSYPDFEDWGLYIEKSDENGELVISCTGSCEDDNFLWEISISEPKRLFRKPRFHERDIKSFYQLLGNILTENNITFNNNK